MHLPPQILGNYYGFRYSTILDNVCRPYRGLFSQPDKLLWPTNDLNFIILVVNMSLNIVQLKDEKILVNRPI